MSEFEILETEFDIEKLNSNLNYKEDSTFSNDYENVIKANKSSVMAVAITGACLFVPINEVLADEYSSLLLDSSQNCILKSLEYHNNLQVPFADYLEELNKESIIPFRRKHEIRNEILSFRSLRNNWDGSGAIPMEVEVASNVMELMEFIPESIFSKIDDYYPNPNGTICLSWENKVGETVMTEIGNVSMSYYVKLSSQKPIFFNDVKINSEESKKFSKYIQSL